MRSDYGHVKVKVQTFYCRGEVKSGSRRLRYLRIVWRWRALRTRTVPACDAGPRRARAGPARWQRNAKINRYIARSITLHC